MKPTKILPSIRRKDLDLSIIIISYNTKILLKNCLESLKQSLKDSTCIYETIVIDNNSTDGSWEMVKNDYPKATLIRNKENIGFGKANNQAVREAKGRVLLFLNSDVVVLENGVEKLFNYFSSLPQESIIGGKLFNPDHTPQSSCGPKYSLVNIFIALFLKGDHFHITRYSPTVVTQVDWVMGACIMLKRSTFERLDGFDNAIFMYMEEIDLQYRAQKEGISIYFYPHAHFVHVGHASSTGRANPIQNVFLGLIYFYKKHHSDIDSRILRAILLLKSVIAIAVFTILGKKYDRNIYIKALEIIK